MSNLLSYILAKKYTNSVALGQGAIQGNPGADGRTPEIRNSGTHIQWRYLGEANWKDIIAIEDITGQNGTNGINGIDGVNGINGETPEFQLSGDTLQYKYPSQTAWTDLITFTESGVGGTARTTVMDGAINVTTPVGGWKNGDTISATDNLFDVVKKMVNPVVAPTYINPTLTLSGSAPLQVEIGSNVTLTLTPNFTQNDAGAITEYRLRQDGATVFTNASAAANTRPQFQLTANTVFNAQADYGQGAVKNDSEGNPYPTGQIQAGTVNSGNVTYTAIRRAFFGSYAGADVPNTSALIRALTQSVNNPANNTQLAANFQQGHRTLVFAYPATLREATSITSAALGNIPVSNFTNIEVNVEGANGYSPVPYRVYYITTDIPVSANDTYSLTI